MLATQNVMLATPNVTLAFLIVTLALQARRNTAATLSPPASAPTAWKEEEEGETKNKTDRQIDSQGMYTPFLYNSAVPKL
jgi:hypothetical protein